MVSIWWIIRCSIWCRTAVIEKELKLIGKGYSKHPQVDLVENIMLLTLILLLIVSSVTPNIWPVHGAWNHTDAVNEGSPPPSIITTWVFPRYFEIATHIRVGHLSKSCVRLSSYTLRSGNDITRRKINLDDTGDNIRASSKHKKSLWWLIFTSGGSWYCIIEICSNQGRKDADCILLLIACAFIGLVVQNCSRTQWGH